VELKKGELMKTNYIKLPIVGLFACILALIFSVSASAHVTVKPAEVLTASFNSFIVGAPNEKEMAFNEIKLEIPEGLKHVTPSVKPSWDVNVEKVGEGEEATVKSITWSGGSVPSGFREDFAFSAQAPGEAGDIQWKAYQTYEDGVTVSWNLSSEEQAKSDDDSHDFSTSGPFSVTKVVVENAENTQATDSSAVADAQNKADISFYIATTGVIVGLVALYFATRKK
jgi:uncharacterized protein YcnI